MVASTCRSRPSLHVLAAHRDSHDTLEQIMPSSHQVETALLVASAFCSTNCSMNACNTAPLNFLAGTLAQLWLALASLVQLWECTAGVLQHTECSLQVSLVQKEHDCRLQAFFAPQPHQCSQHTCTSPKSRGWSSSPSARHSGPKWFRAKATPAGQHGSLLKSIREKKAFTPMAVPVSPASGV